MSKVNFFHLFFLLYVPGIPQKNKAACLPSDLLALTIYLKSYFSYEFFSIVAKLKFAIITIFKCTVQ